VVKVSLKIINLDRLPLGSKGEIVSLDIQGPIRRRLLDLGFIPGSAVKTYLKSPSGDPMAFRIKNSIISLRCEDASKISILYKSH
jgi:ferrous iron transport protein A